MVSFYPWLSTFVPTSKVLVRITITLTGLLGAGGVTSLSTTFVQTGNTCQIIDQCFRASSPCVWLQLSWAGFGNPHTVNPEVSFVIYMCQSDSSLGKEFWQQHLVKL